MANSINIKSKIKNYNIQFINNFDQEIINQLNNSDFLIVDEYIYKKYIKFLDEIKEKKIIRIRANERAKEYLSIHDVIKKLLKAGIKKNSKIIACGGGITQDVASFIASILFRGVNWIFFPTTLLAQGDSCIGSKTSINFLQFKNQIGTFYPPSKIYIDINFLKTLNKQEVKSGLGEISHYLIIGGKKSFNILKNEINNKKINFQKLIFESLKIKKKIIEIDEYDQNKRIIFNYGHTFAHSIESTTNYKIPHGIAVSMGIDIANYFSVQIRSMSKKTREEIKKTISKIWKLDNFETINIEKMIKAIKNDKKYKDNYINLILCKNFGIVYKKKILLDNNFKKIIKRYFDDKEYN